MRNFILHRSLPDPGSMGSSMQLLHSFFSRCTSNASIKAGNIACFFIVYFGLSAFLCAQRQLPQLDTARDSAISQLDYLQIYVMQQIWDARDDGNQNQGSKTGSSVISILDLAAPRKAVEVFNRGVSWLKAQNPKEAIRYLEKAVRLYPKFVSAHTALGFAYFDERDARAKSEFETVTQLDVRSATAFLNLGAIALGNRDFPAAEANLKRAATLSPNAAKVLSALAYAQNGNREYAESLQTAQQVHALGDRGMAIVHYIAALDAQGLHDMDVFHRELQSLLNEDPGNPLAPLARRALNGEAYPANASSNIEEMREAERHVITFPNSEHLKAHLSLAKETDDAKETNDASNSAECKTCDDSEKRIELGAPASGFVSNYSAPTVATSNVFTIREAVDETVLFLAVSQHGHLIGDLSASDLQIRDNNKAPARILEFSPQSKLPIHLGLLIDTSDSIGLRVAFETQVARSFIQKAFNESTDLAFVAGFNKDVNVTQDFTSNAAELNTGIDKLKYGGDATSVFDAIYFGCAKLAAYPDEDRVAKVLVVISDGQDNSSHRSLQQTLQEADASGVTVYTVSTSENFAQEKTDADQILQVIAERSGGESMFARTVREVDKNIDALATTIRNRYEIAYKPAEFVPDGKYRSVRVQASKNGKRLHVRVRNGYYARLEAAR
jgi:VWFA-related protein